MTPKRLARLLRYALPYRRQWALIVFATLLGATMTLVQPWPMKVLIDHVLQQQDPSPLFPRFLSPPAHPRAALLGLVAAAGLLVFAVNALSDVVLTRAWVRVGQEMVWGLASDVYARLQRRSLAFHSRRPVGDSMARVAGDSWCVHTLVDSLLFAPATALVMLAMVLLVMFRMDVGLTVVALGVAPFMAGAAWLLGAPTGAIATARRELDSRIQAHVQQTLAGIPVVQAFTQEAREHERFTAIAERAMQVHRRAALLGGVSDLAGGLITTLGTGAVLLVGGQRVLAGHLTVGGLLVFLGYLGTLQSQLRVLAGVYTALHGLRASVDRVMQVLEVDPEVRDRPGARPMPRAAGHVRFEDVTFGYEPERPVLEGVSLEAAPGEVVAIIGATGAGKSTLVSLVPRLFDPWCGRVTIDGADVRDVRLCDLRRNVAVVLQESMLFPTRVSHNIAYGRPDATPRQIEAAAEAARASAFIERLPGGYDAVLGERGATVSGGERQRIAIARALLVDAPILILDEPTSSLDVATEAALIEALERLMAGRTVFIIAHRLSTIRNADRIVVMDQGTVAEAGTHEELLAHGGLYAHFHELQNRTGARRAAPQEVA